MRENGTATAALFMLPLFLQGPGAITAIWPKLVLPPPLARNAVLSAYLLLLWYINWGGYVGRGEGEKKVCSYFFCRREKAGGGMSTRGGGGERKCQNTNCDEIKVADFACEV